MSDLEETGAIAWFLIESTTRKSTGLSFRRSSTWSIGASCASSMR
jgi:hypothetical protein